MGMADLGTQWANAAMLLKSASRQYVARRMSTRLIISLSYKSACTDVYGSAHSAR